MMKFFKDFWQEEEAMGTVEIVIIIAVLIAIAIVFKDAITGFATSLMDKAFNNSGNGGKATIEPPSDRTGLN